MYQVRTAILALVLVFGVTAPALAANYYWTGAVSSDMTDQNNWDPVGHPGGGDTIFNGVNSSFVDFSAPNQMVLNVDYNATTLATSFRWFLMNGVGNSLTINGGGQLTGTHNDWAIMDGAMIRVSSRTGGGSPALILPPRWHVGANGTVSTNTATLKIDNQGYVRIDPSVATSGSGGNEINIGGACRGRIEIRGHGILELLGTTTVAFSSTTDTLKNRIIISGSGELRMEDASAATLMHQWIGYGLIVTDDAASTLSVNGVSPTVVTVIPHIEPIDVAGTLLVDVSALDPSAGTATWVNNGTLGDFHFVTSLPPNSSTMTLGTLGANMTRELFEGVPVVRVQSASANFAAYVGPTSVPGIEGGGDRSIEAWVVEPDALPPSAQVIIAWASRGGPAGTSMAFSYGTRTTFGAAIHWDDAFDTPWGNNFNAGFPARPDQLPTTATLHHLVYTYENNTVKLYNDGQLIVTRTTGQNPPGTGTPAPLATLAGQTINLFAQNLLPGGSLSNNSLPSNLLVNSIRVHDGVLTDAQVLHNYQVGPDRQLFDPVNSIGEWTLY